MKIYKTIFFLLSLILAYGCNPQSKSSKIFTGETKIEAKLNDSIEFAIYFDGESSNISSMVVKNKNSNIESVYGFRKDGITPVLLGKYQNNMRIGPYSTFYSNGMLSARAYYINDTLNGECVYYSEEGELIYKAYYEMGKEVRVDVDHREPPPIIMEYDE